MDDKHLVIDPKCKGACIYSLNKESTHILHSIFCRVETQINLALLGFDFSSMLDTNKCAITLYLPETTFDNDSIDNSNLGNNAFLYCYMYSASYIYGLPDRSFRKVNTTCLFKVNTEKVIKGQSELFFLKFNGIKLLTYALYNSSNLSLPLSNFLNFTLY